MVLGDVTQLFADQRGIFEIMPRSDQVLPARFFLRLNQSHLDLLQHGLFLWIEPDRAFSHAGS